MSIAERCAAAGRDAFAAALQPRVGPCEVEWAEGRSGLPRLKLEPGHTIEFGKRTYLLTTPDSDEPEFASPTVLLLLVEL